MERIGHEATSKELAAAVEQYNDAVGRHQQAAQAASEPLELSDDELAEINIEGLETQRQGLLSERLANRQDAVRLARQRVTLLEAIETELDAAQADARKSHEAITRKTQRLMEKAGCGLESQVGYRHGHMVAAERQFAAAVQQVPDVRGAADEVKAAANRRAKHPKQISQAKSELADAQQEMRSFVMRQIDGQTTQAARTLSDPPRFATSAR